jgi:GTP-binding protein
MKKPSAPAGTPQIRPSIADAKFVASAPKVDLLPAPAGVEVAFAGRSNVGKSTLLNALLERKGLARTSSMPGSTRELVVFEAKASDGAIVTLVDLPGYGYAKRSKADRALWATLAEAYLLGRPTLRGVVVLVDVRRGLEDEERDLLELLDSPAHVSRPPLSVLLVATKLDKLTVAQQKPALKKIAEQSKRPVVGFGASDRKTRDDVWKRVRKIAGVEAPTAPTEKPPTPPNP